jgi:hypothetical protein
LVAAGHSGKDNQQHQPKYLAPGKTANIISVGTQRVPTESGFMAPMPFVHYQGIPGPSDR